MTHPSGATRRLAFTLAGSYLAVAGGLGTLLLLTTNKAPHRPQEAAQPAPVVIVTEPPTTSTTTWTTRSSTTTTTTSESVQKVAGQAGMSTAIPPGWSVHTCQSGNGCEQSDDPTDSGRFLRFGGSPSPAGDLTSVQAKYEQDFGRNRTGYQRFTLQPGSFHGYPSVEWEFEWTSSGVRRHVHVLYWRAGGADNFVYASSTVDGWATTSGIYDDMVTYATP